MTKSVGVHEAKTQLSKLLARVSGGEGIAITRRGEEVARLVPSPAGRRRELGIDRGRFVVPEDSRSSTRTRSPSRRCPSFTAIRSTASSSPRRRHSASPFSPQTTRWRSTRSRRC